jgi:ATP-binding cassette subfamily F protein 2
LPAQSKENTLVKMERGGFIEKLIKNKVLTFRFMDVGKIPPPILQFVDFMFGYSAKN